jgi:hypothetical protein
VKKSTFLVSRDRYQSIDIDFQEIIGCEITSRPFQRALGDPDPPYGYFNRTRDQTFTEKHTDGHGDASGIAPPQARYDSLNSIHPLRSFQEELCNTSNKKSISNSVSATQRDRPRKASKKANKNKPQ